MKRNITPEPQMTYAVRLDRPINYLCTYATVSSELVLTVCVLLSVGSFRTFLSFPAVALFPGTTDVGTRDTVWPSTGDLSTAVPEDP